jgi:CHAT domain-containing protein/Tfp pilus assembly protein PilF
MSKLFAVLILLCPMYGTCQTCNDLNEAFGNYYGKNKKLGDSISIVALKTCALKKDSNYATALYNRAIALKDQEKFQEAIRYYKEALPIFKSELGEKSLNYAIVLHNLGIALQQTGDYDNAFLSMKEAMSIKEIVAGKESLEYSTSLNDIGDLLFYIGKYPDALSYYQNGLAIREKLAGKESEDYTITFGNMLYVLTTMGRYQEAYVGYIELLPLEEKVKGKESFGYTAALNNYAILLGRMARFDEALAAYDTVVKIRKRILGEKNSDYAISLVNYGVILSELKRQREALICMQQSLLIMKEIFGPDNPNCAEVENSMALCLSDLKEYDSASALYHHVLEVMEHTVGKESPSYAEAINNLALCYDNAGKIDTAEKYYYQAYTTRLTTLGLYHPKTTVSLQNLGIVNWELKRYTETAKYFKAAAKNDFGNANDDFTFLNESDREKYLKKFERYFSLYESFVSQMNQLHADSLNGWVYNNEIFRKGLILSSSRRFQSALEGTADSSLMKQYRKWIATNQVISQQMRLPLNSRNVNIDSLIKVNDENERKLVLKSKVFQTKIEELGTDWKQIRTNLRQNEAAVEFISFRYWNISGWADSILYAALIIKPGVSQPEWVPLFEEKQLTEIMRRTQTNTTTHGKIIGLYGTRALEIIADKTKPGISNNDAELYRLVWQPLEPHLLNVKRIYFAPVGSLNNISFDALRNSTGIRLLDKYDLVQLTSTKFLASQKYLDGIFQKSTFTNAAIFGGIEYDLPDSSVRFALQNKEDQHSAETRGYTRGEKWTFLQGAYEEGNALSKILSENNINVKYFSKLSATKEAFKSLQGKSTPDILHLATHGFFFKKEKDSSAAKNTEEYVIRHSTNAMFRSGFILAGANYVWTGHAPLPGVEDGIMTAEEISNMNFERTKLVTLSACQTGLGDIIGSEGVYGLQRGFKMAGAKRLIISLWDVPDEPTRIFMQNFYGKLIATKNIHTAFKETQKTMSKKYDPYVWAAFILIE